VFPNPGVSPALHIWYVTLIKHIWFNSDRYYTLTQHIIKAQQTKRKTQKETRSARTVDH